MTTAVVLCIGNALAADDGAGHAVYELLSQHQLPAGSRLQFLGLGGIDLLEELAGEELLIVVDAVQFGEVPGTVHLLEWSRLPASELRPVSGHGIGVREAIEVGRKLYPERMPDKIFLVGIEGACFDQLGTGLSSPVERALPGVVSEILRLLGE